MKELNMDDTETIYEEIIFDDARCANTSLKRINTHSLGWSSFRHESPCNNASQHCYSNNIGFDTSNRQIQRSLSEHHDSSIVGRPRVLSASNGPGKGFELETTDKRSYSEFNLDSEFLGINVSDDEQTAPRVDSAYCRMDFKQRIQNETNILYRSNSAPKRTSLLRELLSSTGEKTEYAEIVTTMPVTEIALTPSRITRESENHLLRQEVLPVTSSSSCYHKETEGSSITDSSASHDSGIQEDSEVLYENADSVGARSVCSYSLPRSVSDTPVYENSSRKTLCKTTSLHRMESFYENMDELSTERRNSLPEGKIYENMSNRYAEADSRPRSSSKPIDIRCNNTRRSEKELVYSDLDFGEIKTHRRAPSGGSHSSCSSPVSLSSSLSSLSLNSVSASISPPPPIPIRPPSMRRRPCSQSYSNHQGLGLSCYGALYVGAHPVVRITTDVIISALRDVVNRAKMRELRSVVVDLSPETIKLGSMSQTEEFNVSFAMQDIHALELHPKDCRVFGIVTSKPKQDGVCYVLRSEQSVEIMETWKDQFQRHRPKIPCYNCIERPVSTLIDTQLRPCATIIKVGCIKVKKSYLVINESITSLLGRTNPRDFRKVNFDVEPRCITISNSETSAVTEQHAVSWILSLGIYNEDNRYFGYIVSEASQGSKTRMICHVYRCSYVIQAKAVLETIRGVCQNINALTSTTQMSTSPRYIFTPPQKGNDGSLKRKNSKQVLDKSPEPKTNDGSLKRIGSKIGINATEESSPKSNDGTLKRIGSKLGLDKTGDSSPRSMDGSLKRIGSKLGLDKIHDVGRKLSEGSKKNDTKLSAQILHHNSSPKPEGSLKRFGSKLGIDKSSQDSHQSEDGNGTDCKKTPKMRQRLFTGSLIRRKTSKDNQPSFKTYPIDIEDKIDTMEIKDTKFSVSYLCSTIVNPPLRPKHVRECLKQYQKEMSRCPKQVESSSPMNVVELHLSSEDGVQIIDPKNSNSFRREFPLSSIDRCIGHPENTDCFAFSTVVTGNSKHKCHVFCRSQEPVTEIQQLFENLLRHKSIS